MTLKKIVLSLVLATLLLSLGSVAWAAEPQQICFLRGQVTAIEGMTLTVKTPEGERQVTTSDETRFRIRGVANPTIANVNVGDYILAKGESDGIGTFVAKAVLVMPSQRVGRFIAQGTVTAIEGTTLVLDTLQSEKQVTTGEAIFWAPDVENPSLADVQIGDQVVALGRPDEGGSLRARLVAIASAEELREHTVRGKVTAVEGQTLVITTREGEKEVVTTSETHFHVPNVEEPGLDVIEVGCIIAALGQKDDDGTFTAQIVAVARARRLRKMIVRRNMVGGEVTAIEGTTLTAETRQGEKTILTDESTRFRIPGVESPSIENIKVGDRIIALGRRNEDGGFVAKVVGVPKGRRLSPETRVTPLDPTQGMPSGESLY
jgi:RNase P/RNase MRP subunit p29